MCKIADDSEENCRKPAPGYEKEYCDKAKTLDVTYYTAYSTSQGIMNRKSPKQVIDFFSRLQLCVCGGTPSVKEFVGMGELHIRITCKSCGRSIMQSIYDDRECEEAALRLWNEGLLK